VKYCQILHGFPQVSVILSAAKDPRGFHEARHVLGSFAALRMTPMGVFWVAGSLQVNAPPLYDIQHINGRLAFVSRGLLVLPLTNS